MAESLQEFVQSMDAAAEGFGEDFEPALAACVDDIRAGIGEHFAGSHGPDGEAWPPRKDPKPQHPLLDLSGQLKAAATGSGGSAVQRIVDGTVLEIGVSKDGGGGLPGAARHQFGDSPPGIRPRPFLGMSSQVIDVCAERLADSEVEKLL